MKYLRKAKKAAKQIQDEYEISDSGGLQYLETFTSAFALELRAEAAIKADGLTNVDRFGQIKSHPLLSVVRDARSQKLSALKSLNLDIEPLKTVGRPGG